MFWAQCIWAGMMALVLVIDIKNDGKPKPRQADDARWSFRNEFFKMLFTLAITYLAGAFDQLVPFPWSK